jgi:hypothetical protein
LAFYDWLLSDRCSQILLEHLELSDRPPDEVVAYRAIFESATDFRADLIKLRSAPGPIDATDIVESHYVAVKSLETYLHAVSAVCEEFVISPYEFRLNTNNLNAAQLERSVASPPGLLGEFASRAIDDVMRSGDQACFGISCIGQEQLYFSLLLGAELRRRNVTSPILVGGTIFSRIFERGALPVEWFGSYFDIIVRNEGEKPCEQLLANIKSSRPLLEHVPSVVFREGGEVSSSPPCRPLGVSEIPVPDFDDMPLGAYISSETTLPLLASRGCYWGKCEFCHHGMVYGEKFQGYGAETVLKTVSELNRRYDVRHFAFNDEAIPPKIARQIGKIFPPTDESLWNFTGLIKFERFFDRSDFVSLSRIGFRSLYVGLESASERVLTLMKKNNTREVMSRNLADATAAGIWMHCFLFFGFPGETERDARETYQYIIDNSDIISSFGTATFALEHNAPIFRHLEDFGLQLHPTASKDIDVYYKYDVSEGVTASRAEEWMHRLNEAALGIPKYNAAGWVPREIQLCLLSAMPPAELVERGLQLREHGGLPQKMSLSQMITLRDHSSSGARVVVNRLNGRVLVAHGKAREALEASCDYMLPLSELRVAGRLLFDALAYRDGYLEAEATALPVPAPL